MYYIGLERKLGKFFNQIVCDLVRSQSTISREVNRNRGLRGYRYQQADRLTQQPHWDKPKTVKLTKKIKYIIDVFIKCDWSPEQISGRLSGIDLISLHHETIYQYILADKRQGGQLYKHLRQQNKIYRKRYGSRTSGLRLRRTSFLCDRICATYRATNFKKSEIGTEGWKCGWKIKKGVNNGYQD